MFVPRTNCAMYSSDARMLNPSVPFNQPTDANGPATSWHIVPSATGSTPSAARESPVALQCRGFRARTLPPTLISGYSCSILPRRHSWSPAFNVLRTRRNLVFLERRQVVSEAEFGAALPGRRPWNFAPGLAMARRRATVEVE